ncbi:MAG: lytic transglycosylase domain-containing protein [Flavobacteriaceae bacterium]|nr:lytic transglycosylase domain-containing protein [Flavobacteriaceae bacterium]
MKNVFKISAVLLLSIAFINSISYTDIVEKKIDKSRVYYGVKALEVRSDLSFAGEYVPVHMADIKERIDRELLVNTYWQSNGLLFFKRANKYFPIIERILKENNVPDDFKYLAIIESGLLNVKSRAGAKGFWQFMPKTARQYGLEVNKNIDERCHIEKSTLAACKYLKNAKKKLGSWTLAAAAYNAGVYSISNSIKKQSVNNYYRLLLNNETSRYIPRLIAVKEIMGNPKRYGFNYKSDDLYNNVKTKKIKVNYQINDLYKFAKIHNVTYKDLKINNPWLKQSRLNNKSKRVYYLKIPL